MSLDVTVSIVSHGQAKLCLPLLEQISALARRPSIQVVLTENLGPRHAICLDGLALPIDYIVNPGPKGFGANHNAAFACARAPYFCVMNPDVRLLGDPFGPLLRQLRAAPGVAGPKVLNPAGGLEDSARRVPTMGRLLKRHFGNIRTSDYNTDYSRCVDWMAGMCLMFDTAVYQKLRGFDERFFL
jgi:GT2 family glycosyltransferase